MQEFIKSSLHYIEKNLKTDITTDELAKMANYSAGHFCRLFAQTMDSTVASYILKRRLDHALAEISSGRKVIGVVLEYGFDTYAGFYKAFVKMYGCSPKKYLSINKKSEVFIMQSEKDIQILLGNWDIPKGLKIKDISMKDWQSGKIEWQTFKIGEDYYLKTNERSKMIKNIRISKALKEEGISSEFLPIPTKKSEDYLDGEYIFLLTRIIGEPHNNRPLNDDEIGCSEHNEFREKYAFQLGQAIARLHKALKSVQDDVKPYEGNLYEQGKNAIPMIKRHDMGAIYSAVNNSNTFQSEKPYMQAFQTAKHRIVNCRIYSEKFFNDYIENFNVLYDRLPKQLIHGNLCGDTAVYENGEVICFKGFETYHLSFPRIYDITWSAGEINTQPSIDDYLNTLTKILKGYDSINPLTTEEKQSIYYVLCATYLKGYSFYTETNETFDLMARSNRAMVFLANNKEKFMNLL